MTIVQLKEGDEIHIMLEGKVIGVEVQDGKERVAIDSQYMDIDELIFAIRWWRHRKMMMLNDAVPFPGSK